MMKVAEVIVDVPTLQTNTPYSYLLPADLCDHAAPGMRVVVPFGKGDRLVEGFIIKVEVTSTAQPALKMVSGYLDEEPVLTPELLKLANWMAKTTFSFQISCLLTMLPNVMKAKYQTIATANQVLTDEKLRSKLPLQVPVELTKVDFSPAERRKIQKLRQQGALTIKYQVHNQARAKLITVLENQITDFTTVASQLRANATEQQKLLAYLKQHQQTRFVQQTLLQTAGLSRSAVQSFVKRGWLKKMMVEQRRAPELQQYVRDAAKKLTSDQQRAVTAIQAAITAEVSRPFLLEGVTGSGKTEVYLQTIQRALELGKQALMLVPEIALTPQMVRRVKQRFGTQVAIIHSGLANGEKYDEWRRIRNGAAQVVVGARSAVFAPLQRLGIIILDEEHDASYKQEDNPRYQTRSVAFWRARYHHCPVVLGSATPSLESRARAEKGRYQLLRLPTRINQQKLPQTQVVDMTKQAAAPTELFSEPLLTAIKEKLASHEQIVLLLNRRGFSSFMLCRDCGYVLQCPNCDISLTMHLDTKTMKCHYCGYETQIPKTCPNCHSHQIRYFGTGTEKAVQQLATLVPQARIARMDVDTTKKKGSLAEILRKFGQQQTDILLGTQMIAKGLDFPNVTLVGVLNADTGLELPDFRASERTFELLTQVAGRAGRAEKPGQVIIQTYNPDHYAIRYAQQHDYESFFRHEMRLRHLSGYPPYYFTVKLTVNAPQAREAAQLAFQLQEELQAQLAKTTILLGPTPRPIARINKRYYYQLIIKYKQDPKLHASLEHIQQHAQQISRTGVQIAIDPDPISFM
ncbi:primosomal protein N' [Fructilactobacillus florum]|nr:primosomal protein N' [Fructilactobacillus florum]